MRKATDQEVQYIRRASADWHDTRTIARQLNRTPRSIRYIANKHGIAVRTSRRLSKKLLRHWIKVYLDGKAFAALKVVADDLGSNRPRVARMLLVAALRDPEMLALLTEPSWHTYY